MSGKYLVFGGTSGIGLGFVRSLAGTGASVVVMTRNVYKAEDLFSGMEGVNVQVVECDLSVPSDLQLILDDTLGKHGLPDFVLYSAGVAPPLTVKRSRLVKVMGIVNVNLISFVELTRVLAVANKAGKPIKVLAMSSTGAHMGVPGNGIYAMSKAGLESYIHTAARELFGQNISLVALSPSWVDTPMARNSPMAVLGDGDFNEFVKAQGNLAGLIPVGFMSSFISYLFSIDLRYMSGDCLKFSAAY